MPIPIPSDPLKVAGLYIPNIAIAITLYIAINKNDITSPLVVSSFFLFIVTLVTGFFMYQAGDNFYVYALIVINVFSYSMIFRLVKKRDAEGINFGESTLGFLTGLDEQACSILNGIIKDKDPDVSRSYIINSIDVVITSLTYLLSLDIRHESHISIYKALENGKFKVVHSRSVQREDIEEIEEKFNYKKPVGLAGKAIFDKKIIYISDLSNNNDPFYEFWKPAHPTQQPSGSIICVPMFRGLKGEHNGAPLGVFCLTSKRVKAFDSRSKKILITRFLNRVEILLYFLELVEKFEKRNKPKDIGTQTEIKPYHN